METIKDELLKQAMIREVVSREWVFVSEYEVLKMVDRWEGTMAGGGGVEEGKVKDSGEDGKEGKEKESGEDRKEDAGKSEGCYSY